MKRKILSFILTLCMIMSALPLTVIDAAAVITGSGSCGEGITYSIYDNGDLVIRGTGAAGDYGSPFAENKNILNVKIDEGVTALGDLLFENCTNIKSVSFPASLGYISGNTFSGCTGLENISISKENKVLSFSNGILTSENGTKIIAILPMAQTNVFTVSEGIKTIASYAFKDNTVMSEINLPSTLETIEANAFSGCTSLEKINFAAPSSLNTAGINAIDDTLYYKNYPGGVVYLGNILYRCKSEAGNVIDVKEGTKFINYNAFEYCSVTSLNLPASLIKADYLMFDSLNYLTEINVNPENKNLSSFDGVLYNADKTELIYVPVNYKNTVLNLPEGLIKVKEHAADNNRTLKEITIPDSVKEIGRRSFYINSLEKAYIYSTSVSGLDRYTFSYGTTIIANHGLAADEYFYNVIYLCRPEDLEYQEEKAPTCSEYGYSAYYKCSYCGKCYKDNINMNEILLSEISKEKLPHTAEYVPEKAPTCAEEGYKAHYKCSVCGALCSDAEGKNEITAADINISKHEHTLEIVPAKKPTCAEKGNDEYYHCTTCGKYYKKRPAEFSPDIDMRLRTCSMDGTACRVTSGPLKNDYYEGIELNVRTEGNKVYGDLYFRNLTGLRSADIDIRYNDEKLSSPDYIYGTDAVKVNNLEYNRFSAEVNLHQNPISYGFYFRDSLWSSEKWLSEGADVNGECFHASTFIFDLAPGEELNLDVPIETTPEKEEYGYKNIKGDADGDGEITVLDARLMLRASVGLEKFSAEQKALADIDSDGQITASDARFVLRTVIGLNTLPGGAAHTPGKAVKENEKPASCQIPGYYDEVIYCETCHKELSRKRIYVPASEEHQLEKIPAKSPSCVNPGNNEYFYCRTCDKYFKLTENITPEDFTVISSCYFNDGSVISDNRVSAGSADSSFIKGTELVTNGNTLTVNLKNCRNLIADKLTIYYNPDVISVSNVSQGTDSKELFNRSSENTYNSEKNYKNIPGEIKIAGYFMDSLGENWEDDNITVNTDFFNTNIISFNVLPHYVETTPEKELVMGLGGHVKAERTENEIPSTCTKEGSREIVTYCTECGEELGRRTEILPLADHTPGEEVIENKVAPTCTKEGSREVVTYCTVCGEELGRVKEILPLADHTPGEKLIENKVAPTCIKDGSYEIVIYCTVCNKEISREKYPFPSFGNHVKGEGVMENKKSPTLTEDGSYDVVFYCTVCGKEIERYTFPVPAGNHFWTEWTVETAPTCTAEGVKVRRCVQCGETETAPVAKCAHTLSDWIIEKEPTAAEDGKRYKICTVCKEVIETEILPKQCRTGDVNGDGEITAGDARFTLRASVKLDTLTAEQKIFADADKDNNITASDARLILRASVELETLQ